MSNNWKEYLDKTLGIQWASNNVKGMIGYDTEYGKRNATWGRDYLSKLFHELEAKGESISNLNVGFSMDAPGKRQLPPQFMRDAIKDAIDIPEKQTPEYGGYPERSELRRLIAEWYKADQRLDIGSGNVQFTHGASGGLDVTCHILLNEGDEVLIPDPDFLGFEPTARMFGGKVVRVPLRYEDGNYFFDAEELEKRATPRAKLMILSNPNNPTGLMYTEKDNKEIADIAIKNDFFVVSDQVPEEIRLDNYKYHSIGAIPEMMERLVIVSSLSKIYNLNDLRAGWIIANEQFIKLVPRVRTQTGSYAFTSAPGMLARFRNIKKAEEWRNHKNELITNSRDYVNKRLQEIDGVIPNHPHGVYWCFPNISSFGMTSVEMGEYLLREAKVYVRPGCEFGIVADQGLRLGVCIYDMDWLNVAMDKLVDGLSKLH